MTAITSQRIVDLLAACLGSRSSEAQTKSALADALERGHVQAIAGLTTLEITYRLTERGLTYLRVLEAIYSLTNLAHRVESQQLISISDVRVSKQLSRPQVAAINFILSQSQGDEPIDILLLPGAQDPVSLPIVINPDDAYQQPQLW